MAAALGFALGYLFESKCVNFEPTKDLKKNIILFRGKILQRSI